VADPDFELELTERIPSTAIKRIFKGSTTVVSITSGAAPLSEIEISQDTGNPHPAFD
jgi:hypothetical protein